MGGACVWNRASRSGYGSQQAHHPLAVRQPPPPNARALPLKWYLGSIPPIPPSSIPRPPPPPCRPVAEISHSYLSRSLTHPLTASQGFPSTRRGCDEVHVMGPWCPASTFDLNVPAFVGACHPNEMKPRRGGVVLLALSPPF